MKYSIFILLILLVSCAATKKKIALSFDDGPQPDSWKYKGIDRTKVIIEKLQAANIKRAAFYIKTANLKKNEDIYRLQQYYLAGHMIGNHTHSHPSAAKISIEAFIQDIIRSKNILKERNLSVNYFRFPYLQRGKNPEKLTESIKTLGLEDGYVTIDTMDWYIDLAVQKNIQQTINLVALKAAYIEALVESAEFYHKIATEYVKDEFVHTILLHENDLAAEYIGDLVSALKSRGWEFVAADEAYFNNPLNEFPAKAKNHNQGRVISYAQDKGYKGVTASKYEDPKAVDELLNRFNVFAGPAN